MRVLCVHNGYQIRGGEDECYRAETQLLQERGHQVEVYEEDNDRIAALGSARTALRTIWSNEAYHTVRRYLRKETYDVMHVQNFLPLISPSVYYAAKAEGVAIVQTLHNYRLLCPNALFFRDGKVCEDCLGQPIPLSGVLHGCYRNSRPASSIVATMLSLHRAMKTWTEMVDVYIALTEFARQKFIEGGIPAQKIIIKPNFVHPDPGMGTGEGNYALFVGRLSVEKGLDTLLTAWKHLDGTIPLKIVGDGPLADQVIETAAQIPTIEWLGRKPSQEVYALLQAAKFLVFPSVWYEGLPRTIVESYAAGTPIIASNLGSMSSLVKDNHTGLHFRPNDPQDLAEKVQWAWTHPAQLDQMRYEARAVFEAEFTAEQNYKRLVEIYQRAKNRLPA